jgi:hypothetical protein
MTAFNNEYGKRFLNWFLEFKAMLFGFTILHLVVMVVYIVHYEQEFPVVSDHWSPIRLMQEPVLLFLGAGALLIGKPWSYLVAIISSGRVLYAVGYIGLIATSAAHDYPVYSWYVIKTWWIMMFRAQPQYIFELGLAIVIGTYAVKLLLRSLRRS